LLKKGLARLEQRVKKRVIVSVTNDLVSDNRVHKTCMSLTNMGFNVLLVGRLLPGSPILTPRSYSVKRMKLFFHKGFLFYACYNMRLFLLLLFTSFDLLLANDLDTLPANFLVSRLKNKPIVYDSHEYFTEVPELVSRHKVRSVWEWLERKMVPKLKYAYTVSGSIAETYTNKYGVEFRTVRNFPFLREQKVGKRVQISGEKMILYQGAVNQGRGLENAIRAMKYISGATLSIAGSGDILEQLRHLVKEEGLGGRVRFFGRLPFDDLSNLTLRADLGLSLEEDLGLNYRYALPNKLFDYVQANVPVLVSDLPEMSAIVRKYSIGEVAVSSEPEDLAAYFAEMLFNEEKRAIWKKNLEKAARELTWENEEPVLKEIFQPLL
jgi:glycosyltransferase involved in cell wall biosynthesis